MRIQLSFRQAGQALLLGGGLCLAAAVAGAADGDDAVPLQEIVVTAERRSQPILNQPGNIARLSRGDLARISAKHVHEAFLQVPGAWISRGSGQEHLTAIRSPVLTGAGSCGAFLMLEDGIPIRPSGFCNVNQLFEVMTEDAAGIELIRGPGNALYGSNALHGTINVLPPRVTDNWDRAAIEFGANRYRRLSFAMSDEQRFGIMGRIVRDGGFRDDTGFDQQKLHGRWRTDVAGGELETALTLTRLDQETAGFIQGEDAYLDDALNRSNPNPEAFRMAESARLYAIWRDTRGDIEIDIRPYMRFNDMEFLQHFLPGQPLEENGHTSAGINTLLTLNGQRSTIQLGTDVEFSRVRLRQEQATATSGSAFLVATRPQGLHYDYRVKSIGLAPYLQWQTALTPVLKLTAGLRAEWTRYDYENRMLDGNTRDDGSACGFGGCLYSRPADRDDTFFNLVPNLSLIWRQGETSSVFAQLSRGFRAPQMTELYRLQSGQSVSDLESETLDQFELGWRYAGSSRQAEVSVYAAQKRDSVLRDSEGFNVSRGRSRHQGIEVSFRQELTDTLQLSAALTYGRHRYDFNLDALRGEEFRRGNDVDTAPREMASLQLVWSASDDTRVSAAWNYISAYYLDAENRFEYPGHALLNLNVEQRLNRVFSVNLRLRNAMNETVADRADFAFGNYRYFPGRARELFLELNYQP